MKYYIDTENNYLGGWEENPPANSIEVPFPPGSARQKWDGVDNWLSLILTPKEEDEIEIINDSTLKALLTKRPAQIDTYIDDNINNLAEAKSYLKKLTRIVKVIAAETFT